MAVTKVKCGSSAKYFAVIELPSALYYVTGNKRSWSRRGRTRLKLPGPLDSELTDGVEVLLSPTEQPVLVRMGQAPGLLDRLRTGEQVDGG